MSSDANMLGNSLNAGYLPSSSRYRLIDVWNAMKTERNFNYAFWLEVTFTIMIDHIIKYFSSLLVCLAVFLILLVSGCGFFVLIPRVTKPFTFWFFFNIIWGLSLVINILFNYIMAVISDPGYTSSPDPHHHIDEERASNDQLCKKCNMLKPKRAHHCSICKRCVVKMDHHCPWINNCVGHRNYRYFFLFMFWTFVATLYVTILSTPVAFEEDSILKAVVDDIIHKYSIFPSAQPHRSELVMSDVTKNLRVNEQDTPVYDHHISSDQPHMIDRQDDSIDNTLKKEKKQDLYTFIRMVMALMMTKTPITDSSSSTSAAVDVLPLSPVDMMIHADSLNQRLSSLSRSDLSMITIFLISSGVCIGVGTLLSMHVYLVSTGQTTIELYIGMTIRDKLKKSGRNYSYKHPYDLGIRRNLQHVFGPTPWYLAIWPSLRDPPPAVPDIGPERMQLMQAYEDLSGI